MCRACDRELGDFMVIPVFGRMTEIDIWQAKLSTIKMKERERKNLNVIVLSAYCCVIWVQQAPHGNTHV